MAFEEVPRRSEERRTAIMSPSEVMPHIGGGVYGLPEAAHYTQVHVNTVRSWFRSDGLFRSAYDSVDGRHAIGFLDMIDVWVVGQLRHCRVPMPTIRLAHAIMKRDLKTEHPFCHNAIYTDGQSIIRDTAAELGSADLLEVVGGQRLFPRYMMPRLKQIDYGASELAERWRIHKGVVIDPRISLGKPVVEHSGTTTFVVARQYWANHGDVDLVAYLFGLTPDAVRDAVAFEGAFAKAA